MSEIGDTISSGDPSEFAQCVCGSVWFDARVAFMRGHALPTAIAQPSICSDCDQEINTHLIEGGA